MDALFSDAVTIPLEERPLFQESIIDLPAALHYLPLSEFPDPGPPPMIKGGAVTFGVFSDTENIHEGVLELWAAVLKALPTARLLIKIPMIKPAEMAAHYREVLAKRGVERSRIEVRGRSSLERHLEPCREVDILLDTTPHGSALLTLEALRMGLPIITLLGKSPAGRLSASLCHTLGLKEWAVWTRRQFVAKAQQMAADPEALAELRASLRKRFDASALGDHATFMEAVETGYRRLWGAWCKKK